jgi:hypothetical protein
MAMWNQRASLNNTRRGQGTFVIALATLFAALSMFFASAVDVRAMLTPEVAALRAGAGPEVVVIPEEWVWRGRAPLSLEHMYGNHEPPRPDFIRMHRAP